MRFQVLGLVGAWAGDTQIDVRGSKMRTFLAALLLARGRVVSDSRLMQMLWDEDLPSTTQAQIQTYASRLRSLLGAEARIMRQPPGYRFDFLASDHMQLDLIEFETLAAKGSAALAAGRHAEASRQLRDALSRWNGPALGGVTDHLATVEQPCLEEARLTALEHCIDAELALGEHQRLITEVTAVVAAEPLRERPRMQLMTALHGCGRTADALAVYQDFRSTLAEQVGLDPSTELRDLHQSILTAAPPTQRAPIKLWIQRQETDPALPPEPSDFTGRAEETERACAVLTGSPEHGELPTACVISGVNGAGKTTLAQRVTRLLGTQFPDHQLLVDLGDRRPSPPSGATELDGVLTRLGVPAERLPESPAAKVELYRRTLMGTRTLLILDDAHDERQVRPLLPSVPGCGVLITSRSLLATLEGAARITLGAFTPEESMELLGRIIGRDRLAAERRTALAIAEMCGHLPIAIRVCGARLAARPHWSLGRLADRLQDPRRVLDELRVGELDVRDRLMPSLTRLSDDLRTAVLRLSRLGPGTFSVDRAAELLRLSVVDALDVLDELVAAHLLSPQPLVANHYRLPELVHALALGEEQLCKAG